MFCVIDNSCYQAWESETRTWLSMRKWEVVLWEHVSYGNPRRLQFCWSFNFLISKTFLEISMSLSQDSWAQYPCSSPSSGPAWAHVSARICVPGHPWWVEVEYVTKLQEEPGLCDCSVFGKHLKSGKGSRIQPWNLEQIGNQAEGLKVKSCRK